MVVRGRGRVLRRRADADSRTLLSLDRTSRDDRELSRNVVAPATEVHSRRRFDNKLGYLECQLSARASDPSNRRFHKTFGRSPTTGPGRMRSIRFAGHPNGGVQPAYSSQSLKSTAAKVQTRGDVRTFGQPEFSPVRLLRCRGRSGLTPPECFRRSAATTTLDSRTSKKAIHDGDHAATTEPLRVGPRRGPAGDVRLPSILLPRTGGLRGGVPDQREGLPSALGSAADWDRSGPPVAHVRSLLPRLRADAAGRSVLA